MSQFENKQEEQSFVSEAFKLMNKSLDEDKENREAALDDDKFIVNHENGQWNDTIYKSRTTNNKPCVVINKTAVAANKIKNEAKDTDIEIKVFPSDDIGDPDTAKIINGLIRNIQKNSDSDIAFDNAFDGSVDHGLGYYRVKTDFVSDRSFDQEIKIEQIVNPFNVVRDMNAQDRNLEDMKYLFIFDDMDKDAYEESYPETKTVGIPIDTNGSNTPAGNQGLQNTIRIAEYFRVEEKDIEIHEVILNNDFDGIVNEERIIDDKELSELREDENNEIEIIRSRPSVDRKVKWYLINGAEVIESATFPGKRIPVIPVWGRTKSIQGQFLSWGIVRNAKDPGRIYNYAKSTELERLALSPKAKWLGAKGQFEGIENEWANANNQDKNYLEYIPTTVKGQTAPPPMKVEFDGVPVGFFNLSQAATQDIKETTGIGIDVNGMQSNVSGEAVYQRGLQADANNSDFMGNLAKSVKSCARLIIDLIPEIYDTERIIRILGPKDIPEVVQVNQLNETPDGKIYDFSIGKYDVDVQVGPSSGTRRQESTEFMLKLMDSLSVSNPAAAVAFADLVAGKQDFEGSEELTRRLATLLPPEMQETDEKLTEDQLQAAVAQLQAQLQQTQAENEQLKFIVQGEENKQAGEDRRAILKSQTELEKTEMNNQADILQARIKERGDVTEELIKADMSLQTDIPTI